MADARDLTYGVGFQASDALNAIEQMESGLGDVDEAVDRAEAGAQSCSRAISDMGAAGADAARDAGAAAQTRSTLTALPSLPEMYISYGTAMTLL